MPSILWNNMEVLVYLDTILVPLSFFLLIGYHVYLWYTFKTKPSLTTIGIDSMRRRKWFLEIMEVSPRPSFIVPVEKKLPFFILQKETLILGFYLYLLIIWFAGRWYEGYAGNPKLEKHSNGGNIHSFYSNCFKLDFGSSHQQCLQCKSPRYQKPIFWFAVWKHLCSEIWVGLISHVV